jgi:hypothetical protein
MQILTKRYKKGSKVYGNKELRVGVPCCKLVFRATAVLWGVFYTGAAPPGGRSV